MQTWLKVSLRFSSILLDSNYTMFWASLVAQTIMHVCLQRGRPGFDPWVRKIPWRRKWQPIPVVLHGEFHGLRSLVGYSPWGCRELDMTEHITAEI